MDPLLDLFLGNYWKLLLKSDSYQHCNICTSSIRTSTEIMLFLSYWWPHGNTRHVYQRWALWCFTLEYTDVLKGDVSHLYSTQPNIQSCHHTVTSHEHAHVIQFALQLGRESSKDTTASSWYVRLLLTKPSLSVDSPYSRFLPRMFLSTLPSQSFP